MFKISDLLAEEYSTATGEKKTGLSFNGEGTVFFGISEDHVKNFNVEQLRGSKNWCVIYHGIRFEVDEFTGQKLKNYLALLSENESS